MRTTRHKDRINCEMKTCRMLPNASFLGFTRIPIWLTDKNTRALFSDYISIYDIQCVVKDKATVPIYYESRQAKIELAQSERSRIDPEFDEATEGEEVEHKEARQVRDATELSADSFVVYWLLKKEGISQADTVANAAGEAFEWYPHWQTSRD